MSAVRVGVPGLRTLNRAATAWQLNSSDCWMAFDHKPTRGVPEMNAGRASAEVLKVRSETNVSKSNLQGLGC